MKKNYVNKQKEEDEMKECTFQPNSDKFRSILSVGQLKQSEISEEVEKPQIRTFKQFIDDQTNFQ